MIPAPPLLVQKVMRERRHFWVAFGAMALSAFPLFATSHPAMLVIALLMVAGLTIERSGWARPSSRVIWASFLVLALTWIRFWMVDLGQAQIRYILILLPFPGLLLAMLKGGQSTIRDFWAGVLLALGPIFTVMMLRANNGCTGVSSAYTQTLWVTGPLLFVLGPSIFAELVGYRAYARD